MIKHYLKIVVTPLRKLKRRIYLHSISNDLHKLAQFYGTDKINSHFYIEHYERHFGSLKDREIKLLEIGVGGYSNSSVGAHSLRMWKRFFRKGKIFGLDIHDKSIFEEERIKIFKGNQVDEFFLEKVYVETGDLDIIIDDGSHLNEHVIQTFKLLFPKLKDGGIYVVEDLQTSYWPTYGGDSTDLNNPSTSMNFFKSLTDGLNNEEYLLPGYEKNYFDRKVISIHFYHNLIFIYKGNNNEISNIVVNNQLPEVY